MWENRNKYNGLSVLPYSNHVYKQAPFEDCSKETYEVLVQTLEKVQVKDIMELEDETNLQGAIACGPQGCDLV